MSGLRCPACGLVNFSNSDACRRCGGSFASGQGISTGRLPAGTPVNGHETQATWQAHEPGAGDFTTQPPISPYNQAQPSTPNLDVEQPGRSYGAPGVAPPVSGSLGQVAPGLDAFRAAPDASSTGRTPTNPNIFGQAPVPGPYGSVPSPPGGFANMQPHGGFSPTPPAEAAPYARAQYASAPYQASYPYPVARPPKLREGMAITSLVLGCLSPFSCALLGIGSIVGIVLGIVATVKAQRYPAKYGGKVMAIIGITLNGFSMVIVLPIVMAIAIPNLMASRMAANELGAIRTLRSIGTAEASYQSTITNGRAFGDLDQLVQAGFLPRGTQNQFGYKFEVRAAENRTRWGSEYLFEATATPVSYNSTGRRSYYTNQQYVIRVADKGGRPAGIADPAIQ